MAHSGVQRPARIFVGSTGKASRCFERRTYMKRRSKVERFYYEPVVGLSGVIAVDTTCDGWLVSRLGGTYFGVFFFGFLASRLRLSLFPIPNSMPRLADLLLASVRLLALDFRSSTRSRFPLQFDLIVIDRGADEIF
jgi:hypothetical protein